MSMTRIDAAVTVSAAGGGTVVTRPVEGEVVEVRYSGTAFGGTADFKITRQEAGGTVLNLTDAQGPWQYAPRQVVHDNAGSALTTYDAYPVSEQLVVSVLEAAASAAGTIHIYVSEPDRTR